MTLMSPRLTAKLCLFSFTLIASGLAFAGTSRPSAPVSPHIFEGNFQLTQDTVGLCEELLTVDSYAADDGTFNVNVGGFFFPHVNGKPQFYHDYNGQSATKAYTTSDSKMILKAVDISDHLRTTEITTIALKGTVLTLNSHSVTREHEAPDLIVDFKCAYKPITCDQMPWGCQ